MKKRNIRKKAESIGMEGGWLMCRNRCNELAEIVQLQKEHKMIVEACHRDKTAGHFGVKKQLDKYLRCITGRECTIKWKNM